MHRPASIRPRLAGLTCAAVLALGGLAAGCGPASDAGADAPLAGVSAPAPTGTTAPTLEASGTMSAYMTQVFDDLSSFWTGELTDAALPAPDPAYHWIGPGEVLQQACGDASGNTSTSEDTAGYCPGDATIYFSQTTAVGIWQGTVASNRDRITGSTGDFSVAMVMAHEYAHAVQDALEIYDANPGLRERPFELQADCLAGVWAHSVYERGLLAADSIEQALTTAAKVGDYEVDDPAHHGTPAERTAAFMLGYDSGSGAQCTLDLGAAGAL